MKNKYGKSDLFISVVAPVYNAETWVQQYIHEVSALLSARFKDYEIVLIDNASSDSTVNCIEALQQSVMNVQLYCLLRSLPQDSAYVMGLEQAIGDVVITLDAAGDPPDVIVNLIAEFYKGADIVYGLRRDRIQRKATLYNRLTKGFFWLYRQMTQEDLPLATSSLRLLSRRALNSFLDNSDRYILFPVISAFAGLPYRQVSYDRLTRDASSRQPSVLAAFSKAMTILLLASALPLRLLTALSLFGAFFNILYCVYIVIVNLLKPHVAEGWTSLSLQIAFMFFLLFLILTILSEYILRLFMKNQNRLGYLIARESRSSVLSRSQNLNLTSSDRDQKSEPS